MILLAKSNPNGSSDVFISSQGLLLKHSGQDALSSVEDWEGTFDQISDAIENGHATAIGLYFREASSALGCLANTLDPPQNSEGPHLKFVRKGRGRPPALPGRRRHADYDIAMDLASETRRAGKQESATAVIRQKTGLSRASIHRAIKRVSVLRKSHKKR